MNGEGRYIEVCAYMWKFLLDGWVKCIELGRLILIIWLDKWWLGTTSASWSLELITKVGGGISLLDHLTIIQAWSNCIDDDFTQVDPSTLIRFLAILSMALRFPKEIQDCENFLFLASAFLCLLLWILCFIIRPFELLYVDPSWCWSLFPEDDLILDVHDPHPCLIVPSLWCFPQIMKSSFHVFFWCRLLWYIYIYICRILP